MQGRRKIQGSIPTPPASISMFAFLQKFNRSAHPSRKTPAVSPNPRMDLEERKAYRSELMYQSIRETFLSMEVVSNMYRFKVMPVDKRHHRFIVTVDVAKSFVTGSQARTKSFAAIEKNMRAAGYERYGVVVDGVYWRVSETEESLEHRTRASDPPRRGGFEAAAQRAPPVMASNSQKPPPALARHRNREVSAKERAAFMAALQRGKTPPLVRVGEQEYLSDVMPLEGEGLAGGKQNSKQNSKS